MKTVLKRLFAGLAATLAISSMAQAAEPLKIGYSDWPGWVAWDIGIEKGVFKAIEPGISETAPEIIDAQGNLVSSPFVDPHLHTCKVYTLQMMDEEALKAYHGADMGKAMTKHGILP